MKAPGPIIPIKALNPIIPVKVQRTLMLNSDNTCTFYYDPSNNPVQIQEGDKIYITGDMTNNDKVELVKMMVAGSMIYAVNIEVQPNSQHKFHFNSRKHPLPFIDCHFPKSTNMNE